MRLRIPLLLTFATLSHAVHAQVPQGIPRELARERAARVSDVHYDLRFSLTPRAVSTSVSETLRFALTDASHSLLLDYRDGQVTSLALNGHVLAPQIDNGHLVLPADDLHAGENTVEVKVVSGVAPAEKAITRFDDRNDGSEYIYTLFVPMDASMAFPCFDQPDLKGIFRLTLEAPSAWTLISNTPIEHQRDLGPRQEVTFGETHPLSTYLFAFAAGPFVKIQGAAGEPSVYVRKSKVKQGEQEAPAMQQVVANGMNFMSKYFQQPFPFPKYDLVLIPDFPYSGMEHAGATFLNEQSMLFTTAPTKDDRLTREDILLHELAHQWFGDFTTMRWFDDLWLKESLAEYTAYLTMAELNPQDLIWKRFYQWQKSLAYRIDQTQGTTPIYQDVPNLTDAKSAYSAIAYAKGPGVLRQLAYMIGEEAFQKGLAHYLAAHPYGNASWSDLIHAFEQASGRSLQTWATLWIKHRGMPAVDVDWSCEGGRLQHLELSQHDVLGTDTVWPMASKILLAYPDNRTHRVKAQWNARTAAVPEAAGLACPAYVFANAEDKAYGLFLLDPKSQAFVTRHLTSSTDGISDVFLRSMLWGSLWQSVQQARYNPADYSNLVLQDAPGEQDALLLDSLLAREEITLHRYLSADQRHAAASALAKTAVARMTGDANLDVRLTWLHALPGLAEEAPVRSAIKSLLRGDIKIPGAALRVQDRWDLITALLAYGDPESEPFLAAEQQHDTSGESAKYAYIAEAAKPDAANKQRYFQDYLHNSLRSDDWVMNSAFAFNYWNQPELTAPYVLPALEYLPKIKQQRKIFFAGAWLAAFLSNQQSPRVDRQVHAYLDTAKLDPDLRLKVLDAVDALDRTVKIRAAYGASP